MTKNHNSLPPKVRPPLEKAGTCKIRRRRPPPLYALGLTSQPTNQLPFPRGPNHPQPILPLPGHLHQHPAHHPRTRHQAVPFAFQHPHFAPPHHLGQPLDVVEGHARILAAMVNDDAAGDVDVAEPDRLAALEADEQVHRRVGVGGGKVPDAGGETRFVGFSRGDRGCGFGCC